MKAKNTNQSLGKKFMRAFAQKVIQSSIQALPVEKSAYSGLHNSKERYPPGKHNSLKEGRKYQRLVLKAATMDA
ncbi:MAG: hypothetical protein ACLPX5_07235 [Dissulfurispiraceae bacterium]